MRRFRRCIYHLPTGAKAAALTIALTAFGLLLVSCGDSPPTTDIDNLQVINYRYHLDDARNKVWVVGKLYNSGQRTVEAVEVHATLRNAQGSLRAKNKVIVENIKPQKSRIFNLGITRHGGTATVTVELRAPRENE